jgi:hypothetical protein
MKTAPKTDFLTMAPGHLIEETAAKMPQVTLPAARENAIRYCRSYVTMYYHPNYVPETIAERINALEEKWLSKQQNAG